MLDLTIFGSRYTVVGNPTSVLVTFKQRLATGLQGCRSKTAQYEARTENIQMRSVQNQLISSRS